MSRDVERADRIVVELWRPRTIAGWVDHLVFGRGRYPRDDRERIRSDAEELLNAMSGGEAYAVAGERCHADPPMIDPARSDGHWCHVRHAITEHLGLRIGDAGGRDY